MAETVPEDGAVREGCDCKSRALPPAPLWLLYLVLTLPLVLFQVFGTPPFQMPDEPRHFMRALQIAEGHPLAHRFGEASAGGELEAAAQEVAVAFRPLALDTAARLDPSVLARVAPLRWGTSAKTPANFENTAIYPPTLYAPAALGLRLGKAVGLPILESYYLARLLAGLCGLAAASLALRLCGRGRAVLFVVLSLPLVPSAFASVSQDGPSIAAGALAVALWSRSVARDEPVPLWARAAAALALGAVVGARLPLLPLLALLALPTSSRGDGVRPRGGAVLASALALLPIGLGLACAGVAKVPFRAEDGVDPGRQVGFMLGSPLSAASAFRTTLADHHGELLREMCSVLGWWSGMRPAFYYGWIALALAAAVALDVASPRRGLPARAKLAATVAAVAACASVFASFYVAWTPVGGSTVEGLQGRYFVVPALCLIPALPTLGRRAARAVAGGPRWMGDGAEVAVCAAVGLFNFWAVPITLLSRYDL